MLIVVTVWVVAVMVALRANHQLDRVNRRLDAQAPAPSFVWSQPRVDAEFRALTVLLDVKA